LLVVIVPVLVTVILLTAIGTEARGVRFGRSGAAAEPQRLARMRAVASPGAVGAAPK